MDTTVHRHSTRFQQKRLVLFALIVLAIVAVTATAITGSVATGWAGAAAVVAALALGFSLACHRGCTPN